MRSTELAGKPYDDGAGAAARDAGTWIRESSGAAYQGAISEASFLSKLTFPGWYEGTRGGPLQWLRASAMWVPTSVPARSTLTLSYTLLRIRACPVYGLAKGFHTSPSKDCSQCRPYPVSNTRDCFNFVLPSIPWTTRRIRHLSRGWEPEVIVCTRGTVYSADLSGASGMPTPLSMSRGPVS